MSDKETLLSQLTDICKELIVKHGVKHKHIISKIHDTLVKEAANLPKIQVLYNNAYGGFEYSEQFMDFVHQFRPSDNVYDEYNKNARVCNVQHIIPFAKHCLTMYPYIEDLLYLYEHYNLSNVLDIVVDVVNTKRYITKLRNRIDVYTELHGNKKYHGNTIVDDEIITRDPPKQSLIGFPAYKYLHYISLTQEKINTSKSRIDKNVTKGGLLIGSNVFDDMTTIVKQLVDDDVQYRNVSPSLRTTFLTAIKKYGEQDHYIWVNSSNNYNEKAMRYLLIKKKEIEQLPEPKDGMIYDFLITHDYLPINQSVYDGMLMKFGLICASDIYCSLKIGEVPALVDWKIEEYDGSETLVTL